MVCQRAATSDSRVGEAYKLLGLDVGASLEAAKKAFRRLARETHPDVCSEEEMELAAQRFSAIREAYDMVIEYHETGAGTEPQYRQREFGSTMGQFMMNVALKIGHHSTSDGRTYDLWLDLRGSDVPLDDATREVMSLFWKMRQVVDELGVSLLKEGVMGGIVADADTDPAQIEAWDYKWLPLVLADASTGRLVYGDTGELAGYVRDVGAGRLLRYTPQESDGDAGDNVSEESYGVEFAVAARTPHEVRSAQARYRYAMRALVMPSDPASWAVAAARGTDPDEAEVIGEWVKKNS